MPKKDTRIVTNCDTVTKQRFQSFAVHFEDQEAALLALLDAYRDDAEKLQKPAF